MGFMDQKRNQLGKMSGSDGQKSRIINGRLYVATGRDDVYRAVPRGLDDAKAIKMNEIPGFVVDGNDEYRIIDGKSYIKALRENGAEFFPADKADRFAAREAEDYRPQDFVKLSESVAIMQPSENGVTKRQCLKTGDYITMSNDGTVYGVSADEFDSTYAVLKPDTEERELPDIPEMPDAPDSDDMSYQLD